MAGESEMKTVWDDKLGYARPAESNNWPIPGPLVEYEMDPDHYRALRQQGLSNAEIIRTLLVARTAT